MKNTDSLIAIQFYVKNRLYEANVFQHRPMAIIIPDQPFIVYTTIGPKHDSSFNKNRYSKIIDPTDRQQAKIDQQQTKKFDRSVLDRNGELNELRITQYSKTGEPFTCNYRFLTVATPSLNMPR